MISYRPTAAGATRPFRRTLVITRFQISGHHSTPTSDAAAAVAVPPTVVLEHGGRHEELRLHNGKVHVPAIKDAFQLQNISLDGRLEPCDQLGFTLAEWTPGQTIAVTGAPTGELEQLRAEVAALRAELAALQDVRSDLRSVAALGSSLDGMTQSYDELRRAVSQQGGSAGLGGDAIESDLAIIKRLLAEVVFGSSDVPDFTKTSADGYAFENYWHARELAKQIIITHTAALRQGGGEAGTAGAATLCGQQRQPSSAAASAKLSSGRAHRHHHDSMDHEDVLGSFHAT